MSLSADMTNQEAASTTPHEDVAAAPEAAPVQKKPDDRFDQFVAKVRDGSPAGVINNASRINLGLRAAADGLSIWSSRRKVSPSKWRFRASIVTLAAEGLGLIFPEREISEEQQQKYAEMSRVRYFFTKTFQALNPKDHIFETVGVMTIINGILTAKSGKAQTGSYKSWEAIQGILTSVAGTFLTYTPDRERAQQVAHGIFFVRAPAAFMQAKEAYFVGFPKANPPAAKGDWQQGVKWLFNQAANTIGVLYGGIKKMPDGSIVHIGKKGEEVTAPRQSRRQVSSQDEYRHNKGLVGKPKPTVQQAEHQDTLLEEPQHTVEVA